MELTEDQKQIITGKVCPYCLRPSIFVDDKEIYGKHFGMAYWCKPCDAYVGTHKNGTESKGRLANKKLRTLKIAAHHHFDKLWKGEHIDRSSAYKWLSEALDLPPEYTHIGMFSELTCQKVIELSKLKLKTYVEIK